MSELFLAIFPSSQPNSDQTRALTSGIAHSSVAPASWGSGARAAGEECIGGHGVGRGSILEVAWTAGAEGS